MKNLSSRVLILFCWASLLSCSNMKMAFDLNAIERSREIGVDFLTYYWPALILMALILAGSVMGALVLARREDSIENG